MFSEVVQTLFHILQIVEAHFAPGQLSLESGGEGIGGEKRRGGEGRGGEGRGGEREVEGIKFNSVGSEANRHHALMLMHTHTHTHIRTYACTYAHTHTHCTLRGLSNKDGDKGCNKQEISGRHHIIIEVNL